MLARRMHLQRGEDVEPSAGAVIAVLKATCSEVSVPLVTPR